MILGNCINNIVNPNSMNVEIDIFTSIIIFVIYASVLILLAKYLWNNVIVQLIPSLNCIDNIWQIFGFVIFIVLLKRI